VRQVVEKVLEHLKKKHKGLEKTLKPAHVKAHLKVRLILAPLPPYHLTALYLTTHYAPFRQPYTPTTLMPASHLTCLPLTCKVFVNGLIENPSPNPDPSPSPSPRSSSTASSRAPALTLTLALALTLTLGLRQLPHREPQP